MVLEEEVHPQDLFLVLVLSALKIVYQQVSVQQVEEYYNQADVLSVEVMKHSETTIAKKHKFVVKIWEELDQFVNVSLDTVKSHPLIVSNAQSTPNGMDKIVSVTTDFINKEVLATHVLKMLSSMEVHVPVQQV